MKSLQNKQQVYLQTTVIPTDLDAQIIEETARGVALFYKNKKFICQTLFTPPILGEINYIEGLERNADVFFHSIEWIGPNLLHLRTRGDEKKVREMCKDKNLFRLLKGLVTTLRDGVRARRYLEIVSDKEDWNCIVSLDNDKYNILNNVVLQGEKLKINNLIILGDRMIGLTPDQRVVQGHLTPTLLEKDDVTIEVQLMDEINKLGKIDLLSKVPNSEDTFMVTTGHMIYQFDIWGDMRNAHPISDDVKHIKSVSFNHTRTIMATDKGLFELDIQELPNMVQPIGMPRQIVNPHLKKDFRLALYVEDPYLLGNNPPVGIFAKTEQDEVMVF